MMEGDRGTIAAYFPLEETGGSTCDIYRLNKSSSSLE